MSKREQINKLLGRPEASHEEEPTDQSLTTPEVYIETIVGAARNVPPRSTSMQTFRFEEIKNSFKIFHGETGTNIDKWIKHFEQNDEIFHSSKLQRIVFAKNLLEGSAKLFVGYKSIATEYQERTTTRIQKINEFTPDTSAFGTNKEKV